MADQSSSNPFSQQLPDAVRNAAIELAEASGHSVSPYDERFIVGPAIAMHFDQLVDRGFVPENAGRVLAVGDDVLGVIVKGPALRGLASLHRTFSSWSR